MKKQDKKNDNRKNAVGGPLILCKKATKGLDFPHIL